MDWNRKVNSSLQKQRAAADKSFAKAIELRKEEEEQRKASQFAIQENKRLIDEGVLNPDGTEKKPKGWLQNVGDFLGTAGEFTGEFIKELPSALVDAYKRGGEMLGDVAGEVTGANDEIRRNLESMSQGDNDMLLTATKKSRDERLTAEERSRWASLAEQYTSKAEASTAELSTYNEEQAAKGDPLKVVGTFAEIGLDVVTAGAIKAATTAGKAGAKATSKAVASESRVINAANKVINPTGLKQSMVSGATLGVGYGTTGTMGSQGSDATLGDYAANAALGAVGGTVLGAGVDLLGKAGRKVFSSMKDRSTDTAYAARKIIEDTPEDVLSQPGVVDKINELSETSNNVREMKASFNEFVGTITPAKTTETAQASKAIPEQEALPESRQLGSGINRTTAEIDDELAKLQRGELDDDMYTYTANDGTDMTEQVRAVDTQISDIDSQITRLKQSKRDLSSQAEGVDNSTGKADDIAEKLPPGTYAREKATLYRGNNDTNRAQASPDRAVYHADTFEYAETYGKDVSSKEVEGGVFTAKGTHAYDELAKQLRKALGKRIDTGAYKKLTGNEKIELNSWLNHTLEGERLSKQFNRPMPESVKQAFDDIGIDYIRIPGDQFKGTVGKVGHQTEIIELPKPKQQQEARAKAAEAVPKLRQEIAELETQKQSLQTQKEESFSMAGGVQKTPNPSAIRKRVQALNAERSATDTYETALAANEATPAAIQKKINDVDKGIVPEDLISFSPVPARNSGEAVERAMRVDPQDQLGIQRAFEANTVLRNEINDEMTGLVSAEKYDKFMADLDENYRLKVEDINQMPKPRQEEELALLDEDYMAQMTEMQMAMDKDSTRIVELEQANSVIDDIDKNITDEWNSMQQSNPAVFNDVEEGALEAYRDVLVRAKAEADIKYGKVEEPVQKQDAVQQATSNVTESKALETKLDENPVVADAANEVVADALTSGNTDVTLVDSAFRQPWKVFSRWGTAGNQIREAATEGIAGTNKFNGELQQRFRENSWKTVLKKDYKDQTIDFLDQGTPLSRMDNETTKHFERRVKASDDMKAWFQDTGRKMDLPEEMVLKDYLPHIFEKESGLKMDTLARNIAMLRTGKSESGRALTKQQVTRLNNSLKGLDAEIRQMIESRRIYTVKNGFLQKRRGAEGWSRDLERIISDYARASAKEIHMKPALERIKNASVALEDTQLRFLDKWVSQWKGNPSSDLDKFANNTKIPGTNVSLTKILSGARRTQNVALMGASVRTMLLQTTGAINILGDSKASQFMLSGVKALGTLNKNSKLRSEAYEEGVFNGSFSELLTGGRGLQASANKVEKAMYSGISAIDQHLRMWAYDAGKSEFAQGLGKKVSQLTPDELALAKKAGVQRAKDTQFDMDALSIPVGQGTETGKLLTQIQQFNLKQTEYNFKLFMGGEKSMFQFKDEKGLFTTKKGDVHFSKKGALRLVKVLAAYGAMVATTTSAANAVFGEEAGNALNFMGFDPEDLIPFGEQVAGAFQVATGQKSLEEFSVGSTPLLSFIFGSDMGAGATDYASILSQYASGEIDQAEFEVAMDKFPSFLVRNLVPGGTQSMRTLDYVDVLLRGESVNAKGATRFLANNSDGYEVLKGLIGGQYATTEGQKWLKNGMNTIDRDHKITLPGGQKVSVSQYARSLSPSDQAQYITYYQTKQRAEKELSKIGSSRSEVTASVKAALKNGSMSEAEAVYQINSWNQKALQMYSPWLSLQGDRPARLVDDLQSNVLIDPTTIGRTRGQSAAQLEEVNSFYQDDINY